MGINISGIVINKDLENNTAELSDILKLNLEYVKEITFEVAAENGKDESIVDVYYGRNGTLVFTHMDTIQEKNSFPRTKILTFSIGETDMAFSFNYAEGNKSIRYVMEVEGEIIDDEGEALEAENRSQSTVETIWKQISKLLGESFWKIDPNEKALRFQVVPADKTADSLNQQSIMAHQQADLSAIKSKNSLENTKPEIQQVAPANEKKKAWWAFWK